MINEIPEATVVKDLIQFLRSHDVAALATLTEENIPHASTVYYYVDDQLRFYFLTKDKTAKFTSLREKNTIGIVVTDPVLLQTAQVQGIAKEVDYGHAYADIVKAYTENLAKNGRSWEQIPFNHMVSGYYAFVQITPTWIRWSDFKDWAHTIKYEKKFSPTPQK